MEIVMKKGIHADLDELEALYNDLNDYLNIHINFPGWIKGIYPVRETAAEAIAEGTLYVAKSQGEIVGTVILRNKPEPAYDNVDWHLEADYSDITVIYTLAVHPYCLGSGVGKQIMDFIIEYSLAKRAKAIRLDVYEKNIPAIRLYKKMGFEYAGTVDLGYSSYGLDHFELYQKVL